MFKAINLIRLLAPLAIGMAMVTACSSPTTLDSSNPDSAIDSSNSDSVTTPVASSGKPASDWQPQKPIDFVIMAGKGGGADKMARLMQSIVAEQDLASKPLTPINKAGGSGAEALQFLKSQEGDDHTILVTLNSFYTTPLRQPDLDIDISRFTPIARMAEDTFVLWVHKDSGVTNFEEFLQVVKDAGDDWLMAGTGRGQEDEILTDYLNSAFDLDITYIPFEGGGEVAKQLAGAQVNSTVNNPSEALGFYEEGTFTPIVAFTPDRLPQFPDTPTLKELGYDFDYLMQRSVVGAPGMSEAAATYYRDLFKAVYDSPEWQEYMQGKSLQGEFLASDELKDYWSKQKALHEQLLMDEEAGQ